MQLLLSESSSSLSLKTIRLQERPLSCSSSIMLLLVPFGLGGSSSR